MLRSKVEDTGAECFWSSDGALFSLPSRVRGWVCVRFFFSPRCVRWESSWQTSVWTRGWSRGPPAAGCCRRCGCTAPPAAALDLTWHTEPRPPPPFGSPRQFPGGRETEICVNSKTMMFSFQTVFITHDPLLLLEREMLSLQQTHQTPFRSLIFASVSWSF